MLANVDLSDPRVRRYAPVAALVLAAVLALVVPSKTNRLVSGTIDATAVPAATTTTTTVSPATAVADAARTDAALSTTGGVVPQPALRASEPTTPPAVTPTTAVAAASPTRTAAPAVTGPLVVTKHTWAQSSTRRGTPLETAAEGQLPVAAFTGSNDRASYVELDGAETVLRLPVYASDESGDSLAESAAISACPIISAGWERQDGQSFASAPVYDESACVAGEASADGSAWLFDLSAFADRGDSAGFALVPTPGGGGTWHVTLSPG